VGRRVVSIDVFAALHASVPGRAPLFLSPVTTQRDHMKKQKFLRRAIWAAGALAMAGAAQAGVIKGTGIGTTFPIPVPSSTQMAATDAVGMAMTESGPGHVLAFPYFSVQAGQTTIVQVVNSDLINGKAVKLHFRGAGNGDILVNFQLLLAPGDVWTGTLTQAGNGLAQLTSNDKSCTYPPLPAAGVQLITSRLNPAWTPAVKANHTREGLIEAIVMADIPGLTVYGAGKNARSSLFTAIKPVNGAAPCTLSTLDSALLTDLTSEATAAGLGFSTPTGGVSGTWSIADVVKGATYSGTATAFTAVNERGNKARGNFVVFPQTADVVPDIEKFTSDPLLIPGAAGSAPPLPAAYYDLPDLSTPYHLPASEANSRRTRSNLSALLSAHQVHNQFALDAALAGKTDWVFATPTKRYYLGYDYSRSGSSAAMVRPKSVAGFTDYDYFLGSVASTDNICIDKPFEAYMDRETREGFAAGVAKPWVKFCGAASVFSFNGPDNASALSASLTVQKPQLPSFKAGWARIDSGNFATGLGLPLLGASFVRQPNSGPPSANAGLAWSHNFERK
jgi:hypothetical protein